MNPNQQAGTERAELASSLAAVERKFLSPLVLGDEILIGQTVLEKLDLYLDCAGRRLVPNPAHPDQPVVKVK